MDSQDSRPGNNPNSGQKERIQSFEQMKVWQEAHSLVLRIFEVTPRIPEEQQNGLAPMMEKAAIDIPKSIAEGFKRRGSRNKAHYYNLAQSSLEALRYMFILGRDLKYQIEFDDLWTRADQVGRMLDGLIRSMTRTNTSRGPSNNRRGRGRSDNRNQHDDEQQSNDGPPTHQDDDWDDE
jgi:four helix bundle protein